MKSSQFIQNHCYGRVYVSHQYMCMYCTYVCMYAHTYIANIYIITIRFKLHRIVLGAKKKKKKTGLRDFIICDNQSILVRAANSQPIVIVSIIFDV